MGLLQDIQKNVDISFTILREEEKQNIVDNIKEKYTLNRYVDLFLYDYFDDYDSIQDVNAWKYIGDYIGERKSIIFFQESREKSFIEIANGKELYHILEEMYPFEFYVTDFDTTYLICFSQHDILYGLGRAKEWINKLKAERKEK